MLGVVMLCSGLSEVVDRLSVIIAGGDEIARRERAHMIPAIIW